MAKRNETLRTCGCEMIKVAGSSCDPCHGDHQPLESVHADQGCRVRFPVAASLPSPKQQRHPQAAIGRTLKLRGISAKGKNRVREHGPAWRIIRAARPVGFAAGLWVGVAPVGSDPRQWRWIEADGGKDFRIEEENR